VTISNHNSFCVLFDKIASVYFISKIIYILALEMASPGNQLCVNCIGTLSFPLSRANLCLKKFIRMASTTLCYLKLIIEIHILKPVSLWIMESICRWSLLGWYQCFWVSFSTLMLIWHQDCKNLPSFHLRTTGIKQNRKSSSDENGCCTGRGVLYFMQR